MENQNQAPDPQAKIAAFRRRRIDQVRESITLQMKVIELQNLQKERLIGLYEEHLRKYKHLFVVSPDGETLYDSQGLPIPLDIPESDKAPHDLQAKLYDELKRLLAEEAEFIKSTLEGGTRRFDIKDYEYLFKPSNEN